MTRKFSMLRVHASIVSLIYITLVSILCATVPSEATRWKNPPVRNSRMNRFHDGELMDHGMAVNMTRMIGGDHVLRNDLFSTINRRRLASCSTLYPYVAIKTDAVGALADVQVVTVTVSGVNNPSARDWIGVMSPSNASSDICPNSAALYLQTGDTSALPLTCHYPVKFKFLESDPGYVPCSNPTCQQMVAGVCVIQTCSGSVSFRLINIRTDLTFVFFSGGLTSPCVITATAPLSFANPKSPLSAHIAAVDSTGTQMRVTWVSGSNIPQLVAYTGGTATSIITTFSPAQMCSQVANPAQDFGWHDPGYIHTAVLTGLTPSTSYSYYFGSAEAGWSKSTNFSTPPAVGASSVRAVIYGDMGKAERDNSTIHYSEPGSITVVDALAKRNDYDLIFHNGDISYATGFLVEWDSFLELITPIASKVAYMTTIGNHERNFPDGVSVYTKWDSGGECGVPYETYFPMPTPGRDKPWYSYASGPIHFTIMSTEHNWTAGSEQYNWLQADLAAVNRTVTPWIIFMGHRPAYSTYTAALDVLLGAPVDPNFPPQIEPLLLNGKVDFAVWGHVHNYERTCAVYNGTCLGLPTKDSAGFDTYNNAAYKAPVHAVIGTAGFVLSDPPTNNLPPWSLVRVKDYGYGYIQGDITHLNVQFVSATTGGVGDQFSFTR
ncbi:hypothetical protein KC19_7G138400 [Ceratodon purpureus]|uniref:Purple acid phosphatase n=1 Tax=Ceratodon purpureus TaxID=3225 RepID=A0A8T0H6B3_CERPU|nr:hypothetical protein KC19_7G138400 [Ceratodon purpureus]